MEKSIKSEIKLDMNVDVIFTQIANISEVAATTTSSFDSKLLDDSAMSDYNVFVENALAIIEYYGFEQLDDPEYGDHQISVRFLLAHEIQIQNDDIPCAIVFRVSDHIQKFGDALKRRNREKTNARVQKVKTPKTKRRQKYVLDEIIVNDETYETYEEALDDIEVKIQEWLERWDINISIEPIGTWV